MTLMRPMSSGRRTWYASDPTPREVLGALGLIDVSVALSPGDGIFG